MTIFNDILIILTAFEFFYIFFLETVITTSERTAKAFGMSTDELKRDSVSILFKNQGVYNGLIGVLLLINLFVVHSKIGILLILAYIILVAAYGSISSNPKIILKQGGLAIIAFAMILLFGI
jgi:Predicted membrane protein